MIDSIYLNNLRNNDYSQFLNNTVAILGRYNPATLMLQDEYTALQTGATALQEMLNGISGNVLTQELERLDGLRDDAINGMIFLITGSTYSTDAPVKAAALLLQTHLAAFGPAIARESYQNETNKLQNLLRDWNTKPELTAAVTTLSLGRWKTELEAANNAFDAKYVDRSVDKGLANLDKVKAKRAEINQVYYELRDALNARYTINKKTQPEPFLTAINALNGLIKDYNDLLARRGYVGEGVVIETPVANLPPAV